MTDTNHQNLPLILLKKDRSSSLNAGKDAVTFGLSGIVGAAAKAAELSPLLAEELLRHLHRKLHEVASARARAYWIGGRLYNWALSANLDYIAVSGAHLRQVLMVLDVESPKLVNNRAHYLLRATQHGRHTMRWARGWGSRVIRLRRGWNSVGRGICVRLMSDPISEV